MKWSELEKRGVKRCCAMFTDGSRCRRRASDAFDGSWCIRHGPAIKRAEDFARKAMTAKVTADDDD